MPDDQPSYSLLYTPHILYQPCYLNYQLFHLEDVIIATVSWCLYSCTACMSSNFTLYDIVIYIVVMGASSVVMGVFFIVTRWVDDLHEVYVGKTGLKL
jgi:hypothetical protein